MTLLFIHIPKTAGTSINAAAERAYGSEAVERDYGPTEKATTDLVRCHIYGAQGPDPFALSKAMGSTDTQWLTGHVFADKYVPLVGAPNTISFVRDSVDRVISEYSHLQRTIGLETSFTDFYRSPAETNKQFRMIGQTTWQAFRFVGVQDRFDECVEFLNSKIETTLDCLKINKAPSSPDSQISEETRADILKWNERDSLFVSDVRHYLDKQLAAKSNGQPFCFHDVAFAPDRHFIGWAFYAGSNEPEHIELYVDGRLKASTIASEHRPELQTLLAPRNGYCGFRFVLDEYQGANHLELKAAKTGQSLFNWTRAAT